MDGSDAILMAVQVYWFWGYALKIAFKIKWRSQMFGKGKFTDYYSWAPLIFVFETRD
jgi:hypothetical protein